MVSLIIWEVLFCWPEHACHDNVVTLIWLKGHLLDWSESALSKFLYLCCINNLRCLSRVNTGGLDCNDKTSSVFDEHLCIVSQDTGLVWLSNICKDYINHRDKHSVFLRVTGILDNWDHIGSLLGHVDKFTSHSMRELNSIDSSFWSNQVSYVGDSCS